MNSVNHVIVDNSQYIRHKQKQSSHSKRAIHGWMDTIGWNRIQEVSLAILVNRDRRLRVVATLEWESGLMLW